MSDWKESSITKIDGVEGISNYKWKPFNDSKVRNHINIDDLHKSIRKLYIVYLDLNLNQYDIYGYYGDLIKYNKWDRVDSVLTDLDKYNNYEYQFSTYDINTLIFCGNVVYDYYQSLKNKKEYLIYKIGNKRKKKTDIYEKEYNEDYNTFLNRLDDTEFKRFKNGENVFDRYLNYFRRTNETINWMKYLHRNWEINYSDDMKGLSQFLRQKRIVGITMIKSFIKIFIRIYNLHRKDCGKKTVKNGHFSYQIIIYNDNSWGIKIYSKDYLRHQYNQYTIPFNESRTYKKYDEIVECFFGIQWCDLDEFREEEIEHNDNYRKVNDVGYKYFLQKYSTDDKVLFNNWGNKLEYEIVECNLPIKKYDCSISTSYRVFVYENDMIRLGKKNRLKNIERKPIYHININE